MPKLSNEEMDLKSIGKDSNTKCWHANNDACSRHVVCRRQRIGRRRTMGHLHALAHTAVM